MTTAVQKPDAVQKLDAVYDGESGNSQELDHSSKVLVKSVLLYCWSFIGLCEFVLSTNRPTEYAALVVTSKAA